MDLMALADTHMTECEEWFDNPSPFQPNYAPSNPRRIQPRTRKKEIAPLKQEIPPMSLPAFHKALKTDARLRLALMGPSGAGKTLTALHLAQDLDAGPIALIDTERGSASKYADQFDFDVLELDSFHPEHYIDAIHAADQGDYGVLIIDSLSHAWAGKGGALELVDEAARKMKSSNTFAAWRDVTPLHHRLLDAILGTDLHVITTLRSKMENIQDRDEKGRTLIRKVGLQAIQREGVEYEFDVVGEMDLDHVLTITKSRCPTLADRVFPSPNGEVSAELKDWLQGVSPEPWVEQEIEVCTDLLRHSAFHPAERQEAHAWMQQDPHHNLKSLAQLKAKIRQDIQRRATEDPPPPKSPSNGQTPPSVSPSSHTVSSVRPELLAEILAREAEVWPIPSERERQRQQHLGSVPLEQNIDKDLAQYLNYLIDQVPVTSPN
jgi:hypothetical protein